MTFDTSTLLLLGVGAQLLGSVAKTILHTPAQQAQIDRIEARVNDTLAQVAPVLAALQTVSHGAAATPAGKDASQ